MKASIVDLRYRMNEVLKALKRKEAVYILYHGKQAGKIIPPKAERLRAVSSHPFFGTSKTETNQVPVEEKMNRLRRTRYHAL